ncbi:toxin glutamine deamidase domain-containing protein [Micromonospora sp. NPDC020750]|uniref:toxin glutamine deamidase domain-containing protein n=1 Tax=unclassified Micromonospora TaxID=2617518 RepID=UPI0037A435BC
MSLLPSPIPHPLDYSLWELPGWVYEALDWVIGVEWPEGDERAVWDLADQWYGVAEALAGPRDDAVAAGGEVRSGYGGIGAVAEAFDAAWRRVADGDEAPLPVLLAVSGDLGRLVEECGCDIEGAKLEVWIELGILVVELLSLAVAAVLTAGTASPAAGAAITASRFVVQQIFKRLMAQLARKTLKQGLKEAGERAAKRVAEGGVRGLARKAALGGLAEAAEEAGVTLATQAYQNTTGRRHGLDLADAGMSALGGLAGGAVAPLAGLGRHATGRAARVGEHLGREMTGEMFAEQAARLATGQGPMSLEDAARAAASGATGSATGQTDAALHHRLDGRMAALAGASFAPTDLGAVTVPTTPDGAQLPAAGMTAGMTGREGDQPQPVDGGVPPELVVAAAQSPAIAAAPAHAQAPFVPPVDTPGLPATPVMSAITVDPVVGLPSAPQSGPGSVQATGPAHPMLSSIPADAAQPGSRGVETGPPAALGGTSSTAGGSNPVPLANATSTPYSSPISAAASGANPTTLPPVVSASPYGTPGPLGATGQNSPVTGHDPAPPPRFLPLETGHPHPRPAPQSIPQPAPEYPGPTDPTVPRPRSPEWYAAQWAAEREAFDRRRYRDYFQRQRAWYEDKRRRHRVAELRGRAEYRYEQARWLIREAYSLHREGRSELADQFIRDGRQAERRYHRQMGLAEEVLAGRAAPKVVEVDNREDFERINSDDPSLIVGVVEGDGPSALTGDDDPPPIDRSRRYGQWGGLRPPLALHQSDLEQAVPRDAGGRVLRTADPRRGGWFRLANDGGPAADPTRGINCLDCTLSLYETWMHGRPRVSAPRTFDGYAAGDITRPLGGEIDGPGRVEDATGGRFQKVVGPDEEVSPGDTWSAVSRGFGSLEGRLRAGGHGSYAFLITTYEGGGSHAWVALNQNGSVLYLDPQSGAVSDMPLYTHSSRLAPHNVTGIDALILGPDGHPMPLAGAGPGTFSQRGGVADEPPQPDDRSRQWRPGPDDPSDEELYVNRVHLLEGPEATLPASTPPEGSPDGSSSADFSSDPWRQLSPYERNALETLHGRAATEADMVESALRLVGRQVTASLGLGETIELRDLEFRVKDLGSLGRKYLDEADAAGVSVEEFANNVNDVLRFSLAMPGPDSYRLAVEETLAALVSLGFQVEDGECKNFWRAGNRFYGLNCTVRAPSGQLFEVQLHSDASREAWQRTHEAYEKLRLLAEPAHRRVNAFLEMLSVNRRHGMPDAVPPGLSRRFSPKDASFAKWISDNPVAWRTYLSYLESRGESFSDVVVQFGLSRQDFPISARIERILGKENVDILHNLSNRGEG